MQNEEQSPELCLHVSLKQTPFVWPLMNRILLAVTEPWRCSHLPAELEEIPAAGSLHNRLKQAAVQRLKKDTTNNVKQ